MHLIWSALWGAFPGERRLISEFLIPSLGAWALAPLATPREVKGESRARATGEGHSWMLGSSRGALARSSAAQPPSRTAQDPVPSPRVSASWAEERQPRHIPARVWERSRGKPGEQTEAPLARVRNLPRDARKARVQVTHGLGHLGTSVYERTATSRVPNAHAEQAQQRTSSVPSRPEREEAGEGPPGAKLAGQGWELRRRS